MAATTRFELATMLVRYIRVSGDNLYLMLGLAGELVF